MPFSNDNSPSLYSPTGERKYPNGAERSRALAVMKKLSPERALFALTLAWTGGRVSEVLALTPASFQIECSVVAIRTLKRRRLHVREVPISPELMSALDRHFGLSQRQRDPDMAHDRLWPFCRVTAWRFVRGAMLEAGVVGRPACPRGLRHGYATTALQALVPLNLVQRWMGHASITSTSIYTSVCGSEELAFAARFWSAD